MKALSIVLCIIWGVVTNLLGFNIGNNTGQTLVVIALGCIVINVFCSQLDKE